MLVNCVNSKNNNTYYYKLINIKMHYNIVMSHIHRRIKQLNNQYRAIL